jgi:hypothetical protein
MFWQLKDEPSTRVNCGVFGFVLKYYMMDVSARSVLHAVIVFAASKLLIGKMCRLPSCQIL